MSKLAEDSKIKFIFTMIKIVLDDNYSINFNIVLF